MVLKALLGHLEAKDQEPFKVVYTRNSAPMLLGGRPSLVGWRRSLVGLEAIAFRLEVLVGWRPSLVGLEAIAIRWEAIASRLEAIASRFGGHRY